MRGTSCPDGVAIRLTGCRLLSEVRERDSSYTSIPQTYLEVDLGKCDVAMNLDIDHPAWEVGL